MTLILGFLTCPHRNHFIFCFIHKCLYSIFGISINEWIVNMFWDVNRYRLWFTSFVYFINTSITLSYLGFKSFLYGDFGKTHLKWLQFNTNYLPVITSSHIFNCSSSFLLHVLMSIHYSLHNILIFIPYLYDLIIYFAHFTLPTNFLLDHLHVESQ